MDVHGTQVRVIQRAAHARGGIRAHAKACGDEPSLREFYRRTLKAAAQRRRSARVCVAEDFSPDGLSAGAHAKILSQEIFRLLHERTNSLRAVTVVAEGRAYPEFKRHCLGYIDYIANRLRPPFLTVDAIIETGKGIVVIRRTNPPFGWALPGGFVDYGESLEEAVVREAREETGLSITGLRQFHTYSQPGRDPRFHTVGTVFIAKAKGIPRAGDDAAQARVVSLREIDRLTFAFDHRKIIGDYLRQKRK